MRKLGIGVLGLFCGLLVALVVIEVIARAALADGGTPSGGVAAVLGLTMPVLAVAGVLVALLIDSRIRAGRSK